MPGGNPAGVFAEVAFLGGDVETGEQGKAFVGDHRHDVALALEGPKFKSQTSAQGVGAGDHFGTGQSGALSQLLGVETDQVRQEQEQAATASEKSPSRQ